MPVIIFYGLHFVHLLIVSCNGRGLNQSIAFILFYSCFQQLCAAYHTNGPATIN